jgi:glycosyltransferase involved in cell wall biosynthesis
MVFAKRDVEHIRNAGVCTETFFLKSRTHPVILFGEWLRLRQELKAFRPHIVHAHYGTVTAFVTVLTSSAPTVVTFHSAEFNHELGISAIREKVGRLLTRFAAQRASRVVCVSREFERRLGWCGAKVSVIPSSVDLGRFRPQPRDHARADIGWKPTEAVVLFYSGRNPETKRLDVAKATIDRATRMFGPIRFEILGVAVDPDRMPLYLNAADCLLCTSQSEGSPTIVKEAMACNLPIVSVDVGDVKERLEGVANCFIEPRDPDALANRVTEVLRSRKRSNGRMHLGDVTSEVCRDRHLAIYRSLVETRRPLQ